MIVQEIQPQEAGTSVVIESITGLSPSDEIYTGASPSSEGTPSLETRMDRILAGDGSFFDRMILGELEVNDDLAPSGNHK